MSTFVVNESQDSGYSAAYTTGGARINTELIKTPTAVVVFTNQFRQDLAALDVQELTRFSAGVTPTLEIGSGQVTLRGLQVVSGFLKDGLQQYSQTPDPANIQSLALIDRVEVIKGPAGTLFGMHSPGGVVNYVSKAPKYKRQTSISMTAIPANELYRVEFDHTAPLGNGWAYRVVGSAQDGKLYFGSKNDNKAIAASLSKKFGRGDSGLLLFRYTNETAVLDGSPTSWIADKAGQISTFYSRDQPVAERDALRDREAQALEMDVTYRYSIGSALAESRLSARYFDTSQKLTYYSTGLANYRFYDANGVQFGNLSNAIFADPRFSYVEVTRAIINAPDRLRATVFNFDTNLSFSTGAVDHKLLAYATANPVSTAGISESATYEKFNMAKPAYFPRPADGITGPWVRSVDYSSETFEHAFALQDNMSILQDRLIFVAGARYNHRILDRINYRALNTNVSNDTRKGWSRKLALVGLPRKYLSLYLNYAETFNPSGLDATTGKPLPNLETSNKEVGLKFALPHGRFTGSFAYFDTVTKNALVQVALANPITGAISQIQVPAGRRTAKGWELDFTANLFNSVSLQGGIGQLSAGTQTGLVPRGVSEDLGGSIFVRYDLPADGQLKGLWFGTGWEHGGKRVGDNENFFYLPAYDMVDFVAGWNWKHLGVQINVTNGLDTLKAKFATSQRAVAPTEPRTARFTLRWTF